MKTVALSLCAGAALVAGCERLTTPVACTPNIIFGLRVDVVDSLTQAPPASAVLIARTGAFVDSVGSEASKPAGEGGPIYLRLPGAEERSGTYDLRARARGYRDGARPGVGVTREDGCHVRPTAVTARLRQAA